MSFIVSSCYSNTRCQYDSARCSRPRQVQGCCQILLPRQCNIRQELGEMTAADSSCQQDPSGSKGTFKSSGDSSSTATERGQGACRDRGKEPKEKHQQQVMLSVASDKDILACNENMYCIFLEEVKIITKYYFLMFV